MADAFQEWLLWAFIWGLVWYNHVPEWVWSHWLVPLFNFAVHLVVH